jgi:voltage-gated potassium channel
MMQTDSERSARQRWLDHYTHHTSNLLSSLALVYLVTYSIQSIWYEPESAWFTWLQMFGYLLWLLFAIDLLFRFIMSTMKRSFFKKNILDTITVLIPQLRALRALRAFTSGGLLSKKGLISGGAVTTAVLAVVLVVWVGGLMVLNAERGAPGAEITTLQDAIWWAFETITTVGYGDFVPVTVQGRAFAVLVMFAGITVLGVVSASIAAFLVKRESSPDVTGEVPNQQVLAELAELKAIVIRLESQLNGNAGAAAGVPSDQA